MGKKINKDDRFAEREAQNYEKPIASREFILEYLNEYGKPLSHKKLSEAFGFETFDDQEALRRRLLAMVRDGQLLQNRRGAFGLIDKMELLNGHVVGHKDGFGFVVLEEGGHDLFLSARQMRGVFPGDKVLVRIAGIDHKGRKEAAIVDVLERRTQKLVGRLFTESGATFVEPSNQRISQDILIPPQALNQAIHGQMVVVEITDQPTSKSRAHGRVIEILGNHMAPGMEIDVAIRNHNLSNTWSEEVLAEASHFAPEVPESACKDRLDLRACPFVTIDGEDAKDFDDAVFCKPRKGGGFTLYVAIADVGAYVKPKTALDDEAYNRGNSVYFPGEVIPMLPEVLSNELCSLKPKVNRLTLVCEMQITPTGKITQYNFHEAVICSAARLTYNQVYEMIEKNDPQLQAEYSSLVTPLENLFTIYRILHAARKKRGAIDFDLPETKIIFGEGRKIERIIALHRNDAHKLIEECMLSANICAALFILKNECAGLFRIHQGPSVDKLEDVRKFLVELGLKLPGKEKPTPKDYATLLSTITERKDAHLIQTVLLRSLSQAVYSSENKGHFGLAFEAYTHFTSPIRRYPDLIVHRAIRSILQNKYLRGTHNPQLEVYGEHCSMTERRADDATREAVDWLKCEYMLDKVGHEFPGVITSVTNFGFFVELAEIYIEGLVHISLLSNDYYQFDPVKRALLGERTGKRYRIGDSVEVKVVRVNLDDRKIDFMLVGEKGEKIVPKANKKNKKNKKHKKYKNAKNTLEPQNKKKN